MLLKGLAAALVALALSLPVALAATPARISPGQRVDLKVLLLSADGTEPGYGAWKAALEREGVPYDTLVAYNGQARAATLTDARLADYGAEHARYQAVIVATGDLGHEVTNAGRHDELPVGADRRRVGDAGEVRAHVRHPPAERLHGGHRGARPRRRVAGAVQDGRVGLLTAAGRAAFPYLKGPVAIADDDPASAETFGYAARPVAGARLADAARRAGRHRLPRHLHAPDDGREEMVMTVASNQFQNHNQLLRHGMLNWVTRGVFLGYQRNYLELQVDDLFLGDDAWDEATQHHELRPGAREPDDAGATSTARSPGRAPAACGSTWPSTAAAARWRGDRATR